MKATPFGHTPFSALSGISAPKKNPLSQNFDLGNKTISEFPAIKTTTPQIADDPTDKKVQIS